MSLTVLHRGMLLGTFIFLAGCGALGNATEPLDAYTLAPVQFTEPARGSSRHLVVDLPTSSAALATDRILIKPNPLQAQYLPTGRWVDAAPVLIQGLLVTSLQNSEGFRRVGRDGGGLTPDYVLLVEVNDFQAEVPVPSQTATPVHVTLTITMVRVDDGSLISTRRFEQTALAAGTDTLAIVSAFDAATRDVLSESVGWALQVAR